MNTVKQWLNWVIQNPLKKKTMDVVDESSEESFPASDSPSWAGFKEKATRPLDSLLENPITVLKSEHEIIMKIIYTIHEQIEALEQNNPVEINTLKIIIHFMRSFVDKRHHQKEEAFLFPALEHSGAPMEECHLDDFKQDHEQGMLLIKALEEATQSYTKQEKGAREKLIKVLDQLKDIYTRHTLQEENFVFPLAEKYLSKAAQKTLCAQFEKIDQQTGR